MNGCFTQVWKKMRFLYLYLILEIRDLKNKLKMKTNELTSATNTIDHLNLTNKRTLEENKNTINNLVQEKKQLKTCKSSLQETIEKLKQKEILNLEIIDSSQKNLQSLQYSLQEAILTNKNLLKENEEEEKKRKLSCEKFTEMKDYVSNLEETVSNLEANDHINIEQIFDKCNNYFRNLTCKQTSTPKKNDQFNNEANQLLIKGNFSILRHI